MSSSSRRILFLIEPFQIRNSADTFFAVASQWLMCASNSTNHEFHFFSNATNIDYLIHINRMIENPISELNFTKVRPDFQNIIDSYSFHDWAVAGQKEWRKVILGVGEFSSALKDDLAWLRSKRFEFDTLVLWGPNGGAREFCEQAGIVCLNCEMGATRDPLPTSIYIDPWGSHGDALLPRLSSSDLPDFELKWSINSCMPAGEDCHRGRALIALQVSDDANLVGLAEEQTTLTVDVITRAQKLIKAGYKVELKGHPGAAIYPWTLEEQHNCYNAAKGLQGVTIMDEKLSSSEYIPYLKSFDLIVGRSSSLIFEASLLGKRCCIDSKASFALSDTYPSLDRAIEETGVWDTYNEKVRKNIQFYLRSYAHYSVTDRGDLMGKIADFHQRMNVLKPNIHYASRWLDDVGFLIEKEFSSSAEPKLREIGII